VWPVATVAGYEVPLQFEYACGGGEVVPKYTSYPVAPDATPHCSVTVVVDDANESRLPGELRVKLPGPEQPEGARLTMLTDWRAMPQ
jgi:hypothetical protein